MKRFISLTALVAMLAFGSVSGAQAFGLVNWEQAKGGAWIYKDDQFLTTWLDAKNAPAERQRSFSGMAGQSFDISYLGGLGANITYFGTEPSKGITGGNTTNNWQSANQAMLSNVSIDQLLFFANNKTWAMTDANLTTKDSFISTETIHSYALWQLTDDWMGFKSGSWILGLEDKVGYSGSGPASQSDYNDLVLVFSKTSATPIPGAVWLLGSGLAGLVAMRRSNKA